MWVVGCGEGGDEGAVGPVLGDVDSGSGDGVGEEAFFHAGAEDDDGVGVAAGVIGQGGECAGEEGARAEEAEVDGDAGVEVHFPDDVARAAEFFEEGAEEGEERGRGEGEDEAGFWSAEAPPECAEVEGGIGEEAGGAGAGEGESGGAEDAHGRRGLGGVRVGIAGAGADDGEVVALRGEVTRKAGEELAGGGGIGGEEVVEEEGGHRSSVTAVRLRLRLRFEMVEGP